jgi:serine/threonine protein kinase
VFRLRNASDMELICREVAAQRALDGCRYVALWDEEIAFNPQRRQVTLLLDDYPQGYLHNYIKSATTFIRKNWVACIMNCLCAGLLDCHEKGIYHKDIRPENGEFFLAVNRRDTLG